MTNIVETGTYTPTITGVLNVAASTAYELQWLRVGKVVTISGRIDIDPTADATLTLATIDLPVVGANFGTDDGGGVAVEAGGATDTIAEMAPANASTSAGITFMSRSTSNVQFYFTFTYQII